MKDNTIVVFRAYKDNGDILALFPKERNYPNPHLCDSYQHIGQHSSADYVHCLRITRPAKPVEYADLKRELEAIGYTLTVKTRG